MKKSLLMSVLLAATLAAAALPTLLEALFHLLVSSYLE